jgi:cellulose synthase/poly-beta-1,6-N-acetylglucosamine synthase-like glycosyltransferase
MIDAVALSLIGSPFVMFAYAYVGYPIMLASLSGRRRAAPPRATPDLPTVSITVPVYNEERNLSEALDALIGQDYPSDKRQIIVISDASTDATDEIARRYASHGVELLRLPQRRGKTAAENAADAVARGEIIVNIDATVRLLPTSLTTLALAFADSSIGVASGRDVSVGSHGAEATRGEEGYVGYEMWVRRLETQFGSIVGASGCFYATRRQLYDGRFPEGLSRDFASALIARRGGYRAVSVEGAVCIVPRTTSLGIEFRRKVRTMARGLQTLWYMRELMNPLRYGRFAFSLISHKLCRWLVSLMAPAAVVGLLLLAGSHALARVGVGALLLATALAAAATRWPTGRRLPSILTLPAFGVASLAAGVLAWVRALRGHSSSMWEPTRRGGPPSATSHPA